MTFEALENLEILIILYKTTAIDNKIIWVVEKIDYTIDASLLSNKPARIGTVLIWYTVNGFLKDEWHCKFISPINTQERISNCKSEDELLQKISEKTW